MRTHNHHLKNRIALGSAALALAIGSAARASLNYDVIALTGTDGPLGPGLGSGIVFRDFSGSEVFINDSGRVFLEGNLLNGGAVTSANDNGVWLHTPNFGTALYMRENAPLDGGSSATSFDFPTFSNYNRPAFQVKQGATTLRSIYAGSLSEKVVKPGDLVAGTNGATFYDIGFPRLNASGTIAFLSRMTGGDYPQSANGIFTAPSGGGIPILRLKPNDVAPSVANGQFSAFTQPSFNDAGQFAFTGYLSSTGHPEINSINYKGIWAGAANNLTLVARGQSLAPGAGGAHFFIEDNTHVALNNAGDVAFFAKLGGAGVTSANERGVWAGPRNNVQLIARSGSTPAHPSNNAVKFSGFGTVALSAPGSVLFHGYMTGGGVTPYNGGEGIFYDVPGKNASPQAITRTGDQVPGEAPGVTFQSVLIKGFNAQDIALLMGDVQGTGITEANDLRLWFASPTDGLTEIARQGGLFDVDPSPQGVDLRTVSYISTPVAYGNEEGRGSSLNDSNVASFTLEFTDGTSGVFTAQYFTAVPEPIAIGSLGLLMTIAARRRTIRPK